MQFSKVLSVGISITLVIWLAFHDFEPNAEKTTAERLNDLQNFPNGSSLVKVSNLKKTSADLSLLPLNDSFLQTFTRIDQSSSIMEAGREHYLYFGVKSSSAQENFLTLLQDDSLTGLGIQFGSENNAVVVGLSNANLIGSRDNLLLYRITMRSPPSICTGKSGGAFEGCMNLPVSTFGVTDNQQRTEIISSAINIACGDICSQSGPCAVSCSSCEDGQLAGADTPVSRKYNLGQKNATLGFNFETFTVKDRIRVWSGNSATPVFDTGCVGANGRTTFSSGDSSLLRVDVEPNCACADPRGCTGTAWNFQLTCPQNCQGEQVLVTSAGQPVTSGSVLKIKDDATMPDITVQSCIAEPVQWSISFDYKSTYSGATQYSEGPYRITTSGSKFNFVNVLNGRTVGGNAVISYSSSAGISGEMKFKILGTNPPSQVILNFIDQNSRYWYAKYIAKQESYGATQFKSDGMPLASFDHGFGVFQITNPKPTYDQIFSWKSNVLVGVSMIQNNAAAAQSWMARQRKQARDETGKDVLIPDEQAGKCFFSEKAGNTAIEDAVAIKMFNGADLGNYCSWDNANAKWKFNRVTRTGHNYVEAVCNQQ